MQETLQQIDSKLAELATARQIEAAVSVAVELAFARRISPRRDKTINVGGVAPTRDSYLGSTHKDGPGA